jgi:hypothetical protein
MKFKKQVTQEFEVSHIRLSVHVRYGEEDIPNDFPGRDGDTWNATIELETGKIMDWPQGYSAAFSMKVVDEGTYQLLAPDGSEVACIEEDYVPNGVIPGEYGDYIRMQINGDGVVTNWPKYPNLSKFGIAVEDED